MKDLLVKVFITISAFLAVILHSLDVIKLDNTSLALFGIALLPWLATILQSAELPGGLKFQFQQIKEEQDRQARELDAIRFLVGNFLTASELEDLAKISSRQPFMVECGNPRFIEQELRRLNSHRFIKQIGKDGIRTLLRNDGQKRDVCKFFDITKQGKDYIQLRIEIDELDEDGFET